jgi:hypothetical protein
MVIDELPVISFTLVFSELPRIAPPPLGREMDGRGDSILFERSALGTPAPELIGFGFVVFDISSRLSGNGRLR